MSRATKSVPINAPVLYDIMISKGYETYAKLCEDLGTNASFVSESMNSGYMPISKIKHISLLFGVPQDKFISEKPIPFHKMWRSTSKVKEEPVTEPADNANIVELISKVNTVYNQTNQILDLVVMLLKEFGCECKTNEILQQKTGE